MYIVPLIISSIPAGAHEKKNISAEQQENLLHSFFHRLLIVSIVHKHKYLNTSVSNNAQVQYYILHKQLTISSDCHPFLYTPTHKGRYQRRVVLSKSCYHNSFNGLRITQKVKSTPNKKINTITNDKLRHENY